MLTSKRFFRYQPGRVSAATFGIKTSITPSEFTGRANGGIRNPAIRKYGIYDNFDGYYWETRDTGKGDQLVVVRRTTSIIEKNPIGFGTASDKQTDDYGTIGLKLTTPIITSREVVAGRQYTVTHLGDTTLVQWQALFNNLDVPALPIVGQRLRAIVTGTLGGGASTSGLVTQTMDLVVLRDGLVHVHAAVYDPSLLLEERDIPITSVTVNSGADVLTLQIADGELQNGQHVFYQTTASTSISGLINKKVYKVINKNSTVPSAGAYNIQLADIDSASPIDNLGSIISGAHYLRTPVPFMFPKIVTEGAEDIMWPYERSFDIARNTINPVGYIDTSGGQTGAATEIKNDIEAVNNGSVELHWANWVAYNVKPEFYGVYEFRVPRSRFSGDFMDGVAKTSTSVPHKVYYSDVVRTGSGDNTIKRPGQGVTDTTTNTQATKESVWDLDFTKVIMQKIEFSWYGAVGALFLAYVPISNGEARWVRVHHMRASNQLKVSSLGNATLPITYMVYGGGSERRGGYSNSSRIPNNFNASYSQYITKYGASYYIDGGDRGTVRLYSHSSPLASDTYGSKYRMLANASTSQSTTLGTTGGPYLTMTVTAPYNNNPAISDFYMGASVITTDVVDQGVKVSWVDSVNRRLYLNKPLNSITGSSVNIDLLVDRPQIVYGLETKTEIISSQGRAVRNRVQVYPTRLATGASSISNSTVSLQLRKNPIFQTFASYSETLTLNGMRVLNTAGQPTVLSGITGLTLASTPTVTAGTSVYGWFRAYFASDFTEGKFSVLGVLDLSTTGVYTFTAETSYASEVTLIGSFLRAGNYNNTGTAITTAPSKVELERLSSVTIANELRTPIPGTGLQVTTFYVQPGGQQFDLGAYFDYNKDYLSYPLTNRVDSLYLTCTSVDQNTALAGNDPTGASLVRSSVLASITWEEQ